MKEFICGRAPKLSTRGYTQSLQTGVLSKVTEVAPRGDLFVFNFIK